MSTTFYVAFGVLWVLIILHSLLLLGLVRMVYRLQQAQEGAGSGGLSRGKEAPAFSTTTVSGETIDSRGLAGRLIALLFVSPNCASCMTTLAEMEALRYKAHGNVIVICRATTDACAHLAESHGLNVPVAVDEDDRVSQIFGVNSNPTAVIISEDGLIQSVGQPMRGDELEEMLNEARASGALEAA